MKKTAATARVPLWTAAAVVRCSGSLMYSESKAVVTGMKATYIRNSVFKKSSTWSERAMKRNRL